MENGEGSIHTWYLMILSLGWLAAPDSRYVVKRPKRDELWYVFVFESYLRMIE